MNDAGGVGLCQTLSHLLQISQELSEFGSLPMNLFAQRETVDILHRDEMHTLVLADFVDVSDVRASERRGSLRLLIKAAHTILIGGNFGGKNLQRDVATQARIFSQIHFAHPARAKF